MVELGQSLVLIHLVLFSWLIAQVASVAPLANPGCDSHCGSVSIPYPFGIGDGCFVDDWFEIICDSSTNNPKPFLNSTKLEVMEISVEGTLHVRNPITFFNCSNKENGRQSPDLERRGSPFFFSQNNKFVAVGCGSIALMNSGSASIGSCSSICINEMFHNSCNGVNCCQTTIPSDLKAFTTSFLSIDAENEERCKFAFMVDERWFSSRSTNISAIHDMVDVPLELKWELYHSTSDVFGIFVATNVSSFSEPICYWNSTLSERECYRNSSCDTYTVTSFQSRIECSCGEGFEGNPYVLDGCVDINECMTLKDACSEGSVCRNLAGGYSCPPESKKSRVKVALIGASSGILGLMLLLTCAWLLHKFLMKRRKEKFFNLNGGLLLQQQLSSGEANIEKTKLFKSNELEKATDQFSANRVLGQGGQGTVYKGMLADGKIVAVKKSTRVDQGKVSEFINEVVILSQINHRNVVKLLGCCLETEVPLLVYEFIPNGTLYHYIHDHRQDFPLTLETRLRIAVEIAGAISYMHSAASFPIYHRDIKSSNILLDGKYRAKIADFGTSRSVSIEQTHLTTLVYGTFGYLDPEYFQSSHFTDKSDVYSFGVVIVELLTGQKPISKTRAEERISLATSFIVSMEENRLFDIVDVRIMVKGNEEAIMAVANLAKRCLGLSRKKRPNMKQVAMELERIQKSVKPNWREFKNLLNHQIMLTEILKKLKMS